MKYVFYPILWCLLVGFLFWPSSAFAGTVASVAGQAATFTASVSGTAPFTYQWSKDGVIIAGASASVYTIASLVLADAGGYTVRVSNSAGSATSGIAGLSVANPAPVVVAPAPTVKPAIVTSPVGKTVTVGQAVTLSVVATSSVAMTYAWKKDGKIIASATKATLTIPAVALTDAGSYVAVVSNSAGASGSSAALLSVVVPVVAPSLTSQPPSLVVSAGKPASFSVVAKGDSPVYQWKKSGVSIAKANSATYVIASAAASDAGSYSVTVSNSAGSVTSSVATLTVNPAPVYSRMSRVSVKVELTAVSGSVTLGFVVEGAAARRLLLRGVGPTLSQLGVLNALAQPKIDVRGSVNGVDTLLATNAGWSTVPLAGAAFIEAGAFALTAGSKDAVVVRSFDPGSYTVTLTGVSGSVGAALMEVYELP